jgi:hypothetical protein
VLIFIDFAIVLINAVLELSSKVGSVRPESVIIVSNDIDGVYKFSILGNKVGGNIYKLGLRVGGTLGNTVGGIVVGIIVGDNIDNEYFVLCVSDCEKI